MLYAYCALLDESVLNRASQDDGYRKWRKDPLQARFFSTLNAGEELWERIRQLLREPTADAAVLTCFFVLYSWDLSDSTAPRMTNGVRTWRKRLARGSRRSA